MVFSSLSFLFCFFPAFLLVYYLTPSRPAGARNAVLLVGSCVFYIIGLDGYSVITRQDLETADE